QAVLSLRNADAANVLDIRLVGANAGPQASGLDRLPGVANYYMGSDPSKWLTNVPTFGKVAYQNVYDGIDLVYYGNQRQLEYDFVVAPGVDPSMITLGFAGADELTIDAQGNLLLGSGVGQVKLHKPMVYQEVDAGRQQINSAY